MALLGGGCGNDLNSDSSCKDFLNAPIEAQDEAVSKVASEKQAGNSVTPLERPNIDYYRANNPEQTLGDAI